MVPSRTLAVILVLIVVQSLLLFYWCALPWALALPAGSVVLGFGVLEGRRLRRMRGLLSTRERRWFWREHCNVGRAFSGADRALSVNRAFDICGELVIWRWLLVINGRDFRGRRLRLVLAKDSVAVDDWRKLQVALRFSR